jgi:hypothetical protein
MSIAGASDLCRKDSALMLCPYTGHTQKNGAVLIVNTIKTAPLFCVCSVYKLETFRIVYGRVSYDSSLHNVEFVLIYCKVANMHVLQTVRLYFTIKNNIVTIKIHY